jgi:hypothetical protein
MGYKIIVFFGGCGEGGDVIPDGSEFLLHRCHLSPQLLSACGLLGRLMGADGVEGLSADALDELAHLAQSREYLGLLLGHLVNSRQ